MCAPDIKQDNFVSGSLAQVEHVGGHFSELLTRETNSGDWRLRCCCRRPPGRTKTTQKGGKKDAIKQRLPQIYIYIETLANLT